MIAMAMLLLAAPAARGGQTVSPPPTSITVVMDDNYPPYIFRSGDGQLQGILKDTWDLWSSKTGIRVELKAMDWGKAQQAMITKNADIIDTIFRTPEREPLYDFSPSYATIAVPIYFHRSISGISDITTLRGFTVGVKEGDACFGKLIANGIASLVQYPSYEAMVDAAANNEIRVFCLDKPPADYFLYKKSMEKEFRYTEPLYTGQFHWAVHKGKSDLYSLVQSGFARISQSERDGIERKWMGAPLIGQDEIRFARIITYVFGGVAAVTIVLTVWTWMLRRQVAARTRGLVAAHDALVESENRFRTIFDNINDAIFIQEIDTGAILAVNHRMLEMYGYASEAEVLAANPSDLRENSPPFDDRAAKVWRAKAADGEPQIFEWRARTRAGDLFWIEVSMRRAHIGGTGDRLLVVVRDISERKQAELALGERTQDLERSNADLEQFAYVASHDLREPLRMISSYMALLERRYGDRLDAEGHEFIGFAREGAVRMDGLIRDLLEFSRVGRMSDPAAPQPLAPLLTRAIEGLRTVVTERDALITLPPELPEIACSGGDIARLFQNLFSNALKFVVPGRRPRIAVTCAREGDHWKFTVADNGIGIDPAYFDRIFKIFQRLHTRDNYEGTGIGLAICRKIVERHGGHIWVESTTGEGTTFLFTLKGIVERKSGPPPGQTAE